tara:strand:+ start:427 stop:546 length:120 start_codon:yes stop_codon:yes gene_type:complete
MFIADKEESFTFLQGQNLLLCLPGQKTDPSEFPVIQNSL